MFFVALALAWVLLYVVAMVLRRRGRLREDLDRDLLSIGALALLAIGFFWRPLLAGDVWMPADGGDLASFLYPIYRFAASWLRRGVIPLWNPHLYGGMPFIGDIQSGLLYPVYWLFYLLTPDFTYRSLEGLVVVHIFLAGAMMYVALRFLKRREAPGGRLRRLACLAGGVTFMFSDLFIVHFGNLNMVAVAAWLPLIFLLFHRSLTEMRPWLAAWAGVVLAIATLAGHIQITVFIALLLGFRAVWEMGSLWRQRRGPLFLVRLGKVWAPIGLLALAGVIAAGLCAPVLLPFIQHTAFTERTAWHYSQTVQYSLAPGQFVSLLVPTFFGRGPAFHWGVWDRVEVGYVGILPLILAAVAIAVRRENIVRFLLGLTIVGFLLAMGLYAMLHGWLYQLLPGFGQLRAPARFVLLFDFGVAGLAALGLDALLRPLAWRAQRAFHTLWRVLPWAGGAAVVLLWGVVYLSLLQSQDKDAAIFMRLSVAANGVGLFALFVMVSLALMAARRYGRIRPATLGLLSIGLIFFDLSSTGSYIDLGTSDPTARFHQPAIVAFLRSDHSVFRIDTRTDIDRWWQPDTALLHGLYDVGGIVNPLAMRDTIRYWGSLGSRSTRLYDALNVKYVIARKDVTLDWERFVPVFDGDPDLNVYLNRYALPRAWLVHRVVPASDQEDVFRLIHAPDFDPASTVILENEPALDMPAPPHEAVHLLSITPNRIVLDVEADAEGVVVLSEVFYPGWQATLNGQRVPVLRANYLFRAIRVPPGRHHVILTYSPPAWWAGLAWCILTLIGLAGWGVMAMLRRKRER